MFTKIATIAGLSFAIATSAMTEESVAGNAAAVKPAGGAYQAVSKLVPLPDHIPGLGSLYVDPKTLPAGPFASYDKTGKLVSTIYMIPMNDMKVKKKFSGLDVAGSKVVSVDMIFNAGHPGVDTPHYHVIVWHVAPSSADLN
jgi:hypothetical protein